MIFLGFTLGCSGGSEIDTVKNGTLALDKGITVGQAFQNYKYFKSVEWKKLTLDNGRTIVEADAALDPSRMPENSMWRINEKGGMRNMHMIYQFQINKDKTFEVFAGGIRFTNPSGKDDEISMNMKVLTNSLGAIYRNDPNI